MTTAPIDIKTEGIGGFLLWEDHDPHTTPEKKIEGAIKRYADKMHTAPDICKVNPDLDFDLKRVGRVKIVRDKLVALNNFLVGVKS